MKKISLLLLLCSFVGIAQEKIPFLDGEEIIQLAAEAGKEGDFTKALKLLEGIHPKDSLYSSALVPRSYYLLNTGRFDEAVQVTNEGLARDSGILSLSFHINKTVAYLNSEKYDQALAAVEEGLKVYPRNFQLWYNKGMILEKTKKLKEAVKAYQQTVLLNPSYAPPHLRLGNICYQQDLTAQAMMAYNIYLVLNPDGNGAFEVLKGFNDLVRTKNPNSGEQKREISGDDASFEQLNLLLDNRLALNVEYIINSELDIPLTKQNHLLLSQLAAYEGGEGFWANVYVPLLTWVWNNDRFPDFANVVAFSIENENYLKIVRKDVEGLKSFRNSLLTEWQNILQPPSFRVLEEDRELNYKYSELKLDGIGKAKGEILTGVWKFYNGEGRLTGEGAFDLEGERTGLWKWLHDNNEINETANYKGGKLEGENKAYFKNGRLKYVANYRNDQLDGEHLRYNKNGALLEKKFFKQGALEGDYRSNFPVGETLKEFDIVYRNGKVEGKAYEYFANGKKYSEMNFVAGEKQGVEKTYNRDGNLLSEVNFKANTAVGPFTSYFYNGKISEKTAYKNGLFDGLYEVFYEDGTLQSVGNLREGLYIGTLNYYDRDGKLYYEYDYKNGEIIAYRYFDKAGKEIAAGKRKGGEFMYRSYSPHGQVTSEGLYDVSGGKKGPWKFYSDNGVLTGAGNYIEDKANGLYTNYLVTGEKNSEANYKLDTLHGYYSSYFPDGKVQSQGWYKDGEKHGEWRSYYPDGKLQTNSFFHKGEFHDLQEFYGVDGKLTGSLLHEFGQVLKENYYTPDEALFEGLDRNVKGKLSLLIHHFNNKVSFEIEYVNGIRHGKYFQYDPTGKVIEEGQYVNGEQEGTWTSYDSNDQKNRVINFSRGELHGEFLGYYKDGQLELSNHYTFGQATGESKYFHENGQLSVISLNEAGKDHGRKEFFDPSGRLEMVRFYEYGRLKGYSYLDKNSLELPMIPLENETGVIKSYFDNGQLSREMEYLNGNTVGNYRSYYYSGTPKFEAFYRAGEYDGTVKEFYPDGKLQSEKNYVFGILHGPSRTFFKNGLLREEINYVYDLKHGKTVTFDEQGLKISEEQYNNGYIYETDKI